MLITPWALTTFGAATADAAALAAPASMISTWHSPPGFADGVDADPFQS
jgi:hypothetical protein